MRRPRLDGEVRSRARAGGRAARPPSLQGSSSTILRVAEGGALKDDARLLVVALVGSRAGGNHGGEGHNF